MTVQIRLQHSLLFVALAAAYPMHSLAAVPAGTAQFTAGEVNIRRPDGKTDPLLKGKDIESGQSIVTGPNGRAQVKWSDGGLLSLQPNTEFKISNYVDQADPKQDKFLVDLLRGSMRAITGLIGKRNHDNYKVTTTTATIGIRGSGFTAGYNSDGSLSVTTELDAIEVCNVGGCVALTAGESARVFSSTQAPSRVGTRAALPTPGTAQDPVVVGNQTNSDGTPLIVPVVGEPKQVKQVFVDLPVGYLHLTSDGEGGFYYNNSYGQLTPSSESETTLLTTFSNGKLVEFSYNGPSYEGGGVSTLSVLSDGNYGTYTDLSPSTSIGGALGKPTDADYIGWGTWDSAKYLPQGSSEAQELTALHYILGRPLDPLLMPVSDSYGEYALAGGTAYSSKLGKGQLLAGSMTINFGGTSNYGYGELNLDTQFGAVSRHINSYLYINSGDSNIYGCGDADVSGFFTGLNASRAALVYRAYDDEGPTGEVSGAAGFQQTYLYTPPPPAPEPTSYTDLAVAGTSFYNSLSSFSGDATTFLGAPTKILDNEVLEFTNSATGYKYTPDPEAVRTSGTLGNSDDSDFIGWGYWSAGFKNNGGGDIPVSNIQYIVGRPTSADNMALASGTATYNLASGAYSVRDSGGNAGTVLSGSQLVANFGGGTSLITANIYTNWNTVTAVAGGDAMTINNATASFSNGSNIHGFLAGWDNSTPTRAGVSFSGTGTSTGLAGTGTPVSFSGVAAFQKSAGGY